MESASAAGWAVAAVVLAVINLAVYWANENSPLFRLCAKGCRMPSSFHATRTASGQRTLPRPHAYWAWDALSPSDVITSAWVPTPVLLVWRLGLLAYCVVNLIVEGPAVDDGYHGEWMIYFTHWTLVGMGLQGMVGGVVTAINVRKKPQDIEWNAGIKLMLLFDQTIPTCSLFLTIFYWAVVYDGNSDVSNVMKHGVTVLAMMITFLLSQTPVVSYHFQVSIFYVTVYTVFMWIYAGATGTWPYTVLKTAEMRSGVYYIVVPILCLACFYFWFLLGMLRDYVCIKLCKSQPHHRMEPTAVPGTVTKSDPAAAERSVDEEQGAAP